MEAPSDSPAIFTHFVTVTLQPKMYGKSCRQQLRSTSRKLLCELNNVSQRYKFVAELTNKCNIHYHGMVAFNVNDTLNAEVCNLILQDNLKKHGCFGFVDSEAIKDIDKVSTYINKDLDKTDKVLNPRNKIKLEIYWEWAKTTKIVQEPMGKRHKLASFTSSLDKNLTTDSEEDIIINAFNLDKKISRINIYNNAETPLIHKDRKEGEDLVKKRTQKRDQKIKNRTNKSSNKGDNNEHIAG